MNYINLNFYIKLNFFFLIDDGATKTEATVRSFEFCIGIFTQRTSVNLSNALQNFVFNHIGISI